ncbi:hypothetical protein ACFOTA_16350 [Chitinophaga sp. GCM10012297]|uniref:Uncharacterized protein n=1 Tax=Chitinophaga chungangae TaxID=2821488 RepID=A0ABS3YGH7_9BACT|nr:hypothetical protein [Chitinophaga chungangae]MBO9153792.1 hypothetical protein [Chitinophaga chungangae]
MKTIYAIILMVCFSLTGAAQKRLNKMDGTFISKEDAKVKLTIISGKYVLADPGRMATLLLDAATPSLSQKYVTTATGCSYSTATLP